MLAVLLAGSASAAQLHLSPSEGGRANSEASEWLEASISTPTTPCASKIGPESRRFSTE